MTRALLVLTTVAVSAALSPSALAGTVFVDNDGADCPNADFGTIEAGVEAASAGDVVLVCPGTYVEHVTLESDDSDIAVKAKGPLGSVVLDGVNVLMHGFDLNGANGVLVEGFVVQRYHDDIALRNANGNVIQRNETKEAWDHDGIVLFSNSHGNLIQHNISHDNQKFISCGISAGGGSSNNVIRHNTVFRNANIGILLGGGLLGPAGPGNVVENNVSFDNGEPVAGANRGVGILNGISPGSVIEHNHVAGNNAHGIVVAGSLSIGVIVAHNIVEENGSTNDDDGIRVQMGAGATVVQYNVSRLNRHDGVHVVTAGGTIVQHNVLDQNGTPGAGNGCGVDVESGSTFTVVRHNVVRNHSRAGIRVRDSSGNFVTDNQAKGNPGDGIQLTNGDSNTVDRNQSDRNGLDGIRVDSASSGNTLTDNTMFQNGVFDAQDDNRPANTWTGNRCRTDSPPGTICE